MIYKAALGHNIALGALATLTPQPQSQGLQYSSVEVMASLAVVTQAPHIELRWDLLGNPAEVLAIYTQLGIDTAMSAAITLLARDDLYRERRYNGYAVRPAANWNRYRPRNINVVVNSLVELP